MRFSKCIDVLLKRSSCFNHLSLFVESNVDGIFMSERNSCNILNQMSEVSSVIAKIRENRYNRITLIDRVIKTVNPLSKSKPITHDDSNKQRESERESGQLVNEEERETPS